MKLQPALDRDVPAIVDLVAIALRGKGEQRSWNAGHFIEGPRIDERAETRPFPDDDQRFRRPLRDDPHFVMPEKRL